MIASDATLRAYDERVDVWSFGMLLYELLTLETPFASGGDGGGGSRFAAVTAASQARPELPPLHEQLRHVGELYERCTSRLPVNRPSARDVVRMLESS